MKHGWWSDPWLPPADGTQAEAAAGLPLLPSQLFGGALGQGRDGAIAGPLAALGEAPPPPPLPDFIGLRRRQPGEAAPGRDAAAPADGPKEDAPASVSQSHPKESWNQASLSQSHPKDAHPTSQSHPKDASQSTASMSSDGLAWSALSQSSDGAAWSALRSQTDAGPSQSSQSTAQSSRSMPFSCLAQLEAAGSQPAEILAAAQPLLAPGQAAAHAHGCPGDHLAGIVTPERTAAHDGGSRLSLDRSRSPPALSPPQPPRLLNFGSSWARSSVRTRQDRLTRAASNATLEADLELAVVLRAPKMARMISEPGHSQNSWAPPSPSPLDREASQDSLASMAHATGHLTLSKPGAPGSAAPAGPQQPEMPPGAQPCLSPSLRPERRTVTLPLMSRTASTSGPSGSALALERGDSGMPCVTPAASPAVSPAAPGPRSPPDDDMTSPPRRNAATSMTAARGALSRVMATPEPRCALWKVTPPPAPSHDRERREQEADIQAALEWNSEPLLAMTLLSGHAHECPGDHALHQAVSCHHLGALGFLLRRGAQGLEEPCRGQRPLMQAVRTSLMEGDEGFRMTAMLLCHGAQVNVQTDAARDTPLHDAAHRGCSALVALLLRHGADPNVQNRLGRTPLHSACCQPPWQQEPDLAEMLVDHGADPRLRDITGCLARDHLAGRPGAGGVLRRLDRETRWLERRPAVLARGHGTGAHPVCRVPDFIFRAIVAFI